MEKRPPPEPSVPAAVSLVGTICEKTGAALPLRFDSFLLEEGDLGGLGGLRQPG